MGQAAGGSWKVSQTGVSAFSRHSKECPACCFEGVAKGPWGWVSDGAVADQRQSGVLDLSLCPLSQEGNHFSSF